MAKILVVDDSATAVTFVRAALRGSEHTVEAPASFVQLAATVREQPPDLVLLDLSMPALSGVQMGEMIRKYQARDIPILIYSSRPEPELRKAARAVGAIGFVQKSAAAGDLVTAISEALSRRKAWAT